MAKNSHTMPTLTKIYKGMIKMYFDESIAWDKANLQDDYDNGYITQPEYESQLAEIEGIEQEYYDEY